MTVATTHHLQFGFDNNDTLWASSGGGDSRDASVVGWLNTKKFLETGDAGHSQGWTALIVDTAGAGKREGVSYTEPGKDAGLIFAAAEAVGVPLPSGNVWRLPAFHP